MAPDTLLTPLSNNSYMNYRKQDVNPRCSKLSPSALRTYIWPAHHHSTLWFMGARLANKSSLMPCLWKRDPSTGAGLPGLGWAALHSGAQIKVSPQRWRYCLPQLEGNMWNCKGLVLHGKTRWWSILWHDAGSLSLENNYFLCVFYIQAPLMFNFHCIAPIMNQIAHQLADAAKKFTL